MNKKNLEKHIETFLEPAKANENSAGLLVVGSSSTVYSMRWRFGNRSWLTFRSVVHEESPLKEPSLGWELALEHYGIN